MVNPNELPEDEMVKIALQLEAIAYWQQDQAFAVTETGKLLTKAAGWLRKASRNVCGQGYFGCHGGRNCQSDHK